MIGMKKQLLVIGITLLLTATLCGCFQEGNKSDLERDIIDTLKFSIEPVNATMEEYGIYIFRKNETFEIKVTLENRGEEDLNLLTPGLQNDYEKVFYFQILDLDETIIETDTREVTMEHNEVLGPEKINLFPRENHSFFAYINSNEYGIEHHHFVIPSVFGERFSVGIYRIRGIYNTTGYEFQYNVPDIILYSNNIIMEVVE